MANEVIKNNVEALLMESIDEYLSCDPRGLYPSNPEEAEKAFSKEQLKDLEEKLKFIESDLLNLIFFMDDISPLVENQIYVLNITDNIIIVKENDVYKFYRFKEGKPLIFDVINELSYNYFNFKSELSRFFPEEVKKEKTKNSQKSIKTLINA